MRILHVADLHLDRFEWVKEHARGYDLLVIAGDILDAFSHIPLLAQIPYCAEWLADLPVPTVVVSGNHDYFHECFLSQVLNPYAEARWITRLRGRSNVICSDGDCISFGGLRILGHGWGRGQVDTAGADIVVSHAPPQGCLCALGPSGEDFGEDFVIPPKDDDPPKLILCGHIHQPKRTWCRWPSAGRQSLVLVPGVKQRAATPSHWIIDTDKGIAQKGNERVGFGFW